MSNERRPMTLASPDPTLRHALRHVSRTFHARFNERLSEFGLSDAAYMSMFALRRFPNMSSADLARWTGVTAQGANQVLKSLIANGYVERHPSPTHGRILQAKLTEVGESVIRECEAAGDAVESLMTSEMTEAEAQELDRLLRMAAEGLGAPIAPPQRPAA